jgi:hypothetical protein
MARLDDLEDGAMPDTTLPIHPRTGLRAVGYGRRGPIWPILGGSSPEPSSGATPPQPGTPTPTPPAPPTAPQPAGAGTSSQQPPTGTPGHQNDQPLGEAGLRALQAEREARAAAERERDALRGQSTDLQQERAARQQAEQQLAAVQAERLRLQIAHDHRLPPEDLVFLTGTTQEELTGQATRLVSRGGQAAAAAPPPFAPNPGQAAGNGTPPPAPKPSVASGVELYKQRKTKPTTL